MQRRLHWDGSVRSGALVVLGSVLMIAACCGIVFWALQGSVLGVLLSAMLPGFGAIWMLARPWRENLSPQDRPEVGVEAPDLWVGVPQRVKGPGVRSGRRSGSPGS